MSYFSWLPAGSSDRDFAFGLSAGLGFDLTRPVLLLAPSITYNQNISLHAGLVVLPQDRLKGVYVPGDTIKENLTPDQLREDVQKSYGVNPFVAISFNFSSNPFGGGSQSGKEEEKKSE